MDVQAIMIGSGALAGVGAISAVVLAIASRVFKVDEDPRIEAINEILPGANCGGCGFPGCSGFAKAIVEGMADPTGCAPGGNQLARKIAVILGVEVQEKVRMVARVRCSGTSEHCASRFVYEGVASCKGASLLSEGGIKSCPYGCDGLGDCVAACPFDAIHMGPNQIPVVDLDKCTACGKCVDACPKGVIALEAHAGQVVLHCHTHLAAKDVRKICSIGCISCKACIRACPYDALSWDVDLPVFDYEKCQSCGLCIDACKPGCIQTLNEIDPAVKAKATEALEAKKAEEAAKREAARAAAQARAAAAAAAAAEKPN